MRRRLASLTIVPLILAAAVGGAIAASPGPEAELALGKGKVVKYEGTWRFEQSEPEERRPWRASGLATGDGRRAAVRAKASFIDADRCPTKTDRADLRGGTRVKRAGRSAWKARGNENAAGAYSLKLKTGRKVQRARMMGAEPACNTDGFYEIAGKFTGPKGGTALGKRFKGTLRGNEDPPNRQKLILRAKRVG